MHYISNNFFFQNTLIFDIWSNITLSTTPFYYNRFINSSIPTPRAAGINNPESLALEHIESSKPTTYSIINKILLNQNLKAGQSKLDKLLKIKGVEIDLPISNLENKKIFENLTGKSKYKGFFGVYIFIHKQTSQKYVGSSNLLRRRMDYYFKGNFSGSDGKFLPLLQKEGLKAFKLIIFKLDNKIFSFKDALILEQYFLLNKEFNLNTLRVVNAGSSKGDSVYLYDLTCRTLYYHANSKIELKRVLKIHPETTKKYIDSKIPYLNKFIILSYPILSASITDIPLEDLLIKLEKERYCQYILGSWRSISVILEIKKGNTFLETEGHTLNFDSLTSCIEYLRGLGLTIKRNTLTKYIKLGKVFHNFLCKYSEKGLPYNFKEIGLVMKEYKNLKTKQSMASIIANKKKKPIIVKSPNFEKEFVSITDTIKYFYNLNIILDRKTLNARLKDGKIYKDHYFFYK
jgi:hypothetical protein